MRLNPNHLGLGNKANLVVATPIFHMNGRRALRPGRPCEHGLERLRENGLRLPGVGIRDVGGFRQRHHPLQVADSIGHFQRIGIEIMIFRHLDTQPNLAADQFNLNIERITKLAKSGRKKR